MIVEVSNTFFLVRLFCLATFCVQCCGSSLSYLVEDHDTSPAIQAVKLMLQQLHVQQHPPKAACRNQRLLIIQFINSFEGLGSILKLVTLGLAEAAHSNRTLIFGLHPLPHMFEKSRDEWFNKKTATGKPKVMIKGIEFNCGYDENDVGYDGSGPYACFFQPLSSCTINDLSLSELVELGKNGYDDNARVKIQEERRAPAAYQYPVHNPLYSTLFETLPPNVRHKWAGSLSAYVFRLKPDVVAMFEKRRMDLWPIHLGGQGFESNCYQFCPDSHEGVEGMNMGEPVWGLHVRHGDMKAYQDIYANRQLYSFDEYMLAALRRARQIGILGTYSALPAAVYVSSDSIELPSFIQDTCASTNMWSWLITEDDNHDLFYDPPCLFSSADRFRTEHGSHTVSGAGACSHTYQQGDHTMTCALRVEDLAMYRKTNHDVKNLSLAKRLMRSLLEALEDMYLLSLMDFFVGTLSSHYSTHIAMLVWARKGAVDPSNEVFFLDKDHVESGFHENSYFLFILRPLLKPWEGKLRWIHHTRRFLEGLTYYNVHTGINYTVAEEPRYRIRLIDQLPYVPPIVFEKETRRWLPIDKNNDALALPTPVSNKKKADSTTTTTTNNNNKGKSNMQDVIVRKDNASDKVIDTSLSDNMIWPGECEYDVNIVPLRLSQLREKITTTDEVLLEIGTLLNFGADHQEMHHNQAMRCWRHAELLLEALRKFVKSTDKTMVETLNSYLDICQATCPDLNPDFNLTRKLTFSPLPNLIQTLFIACVQGNMRALAKSRMSPFADGEKEIKSLLKQNFGVKSQTGWF